MIDDIKVPVYRSYAETKRKAENRKRLENAEFAMKDLSFGRTLSHLNAIDLARDRTRNLGHRMPALYQLANQVNGETRFVNVKFVQSVPLMDPFAERSRPLFTLPIKSRLKIDFEISYLRKHSFNPTAPDRNSSSAVILRRFINILGYLTSKSDEATLITYNRFISLMEAKYLKSRPESIITSSYRLSYMLMIIGIVVMLVEVCKKFRLGFHQVLESYVTQLSECNNGIRDFALYERQGMFE
ncbi:hypothetical protein ANN_10290 [Periplaneta americana]|uniref:Uncharacterized protein n=1 Tax=Periplaneta americana TaxID=6978 RepID=A0ABQ8TQV5_PERAM|nr:hypothetical protein ANN_10290 [Periplaneta americana]